MQNILLCLSNWYNVLSNLLSKFDANIKGTANPGYLITRLVSAKVRGQGSEMVSS